MLKIEKINSGYGNINVLKEVSIDVREKEIVAIIGSNGAGKTTLLKTISGIIRCTSGNIFFQGENIIRMPEKRIVELGICQVPEGRHIFPTLSVKDNLMLGAYLRYRKENKKKINETLEFVYDLFPRLKERSRQNGSTLSGGEQQMLALGRALMSKPKLLLLDEPSMGLAPKIVQRIYEALDNLNKQGITILLVEQNAEAALSIAGRGYILQTGQIALEDSCKNLLGSKSVKKIYFGEDII
ncbi:MAG: ABC transporter ATP-binding protein [Candidatus Humimicrobiaceae bacterium]